MTDACAPLPTPAYIDEASTMSDAEIAVLSVMLDGLVVRSMTVLVHGSPSSDNFWAHIAKATE